MIVRRAQDLCVTFYKNSEANSNDPTNRQLTVAVFKGGGDRDDHGCYFCFALEYMKNLVILHGW